MRALKNIIQPHAELKKVLFKMRKAKPKKRVILPDPVFNDQKVSKFVNHLMYDGKKNTSYEIFYNALDIVKAKMSNEEKSALEIWKQALDNITPQVEVKSRRIGGATFQVPTEIRPDVFDEQFTEKQFADILFSLILVSMIRQDYNPSSILMLINKTLY